MYASLVHLNCLSISMPGSSVAKNKRTAHEAGVDAAGPPKYEITMIVPGYWKPDADHSRTPMVVLSPEAPPQIPTFRVVKKTGTLSQIAFQSMGIYGIDLNKQAYLEEIHKAMKRKLAASAVKLPEHVLSEATREQYIEILTLVHAVCMPTADTRGWIGPEEIRFDNGETADPNVLLETSVRLDNLINAMEDSPWVPKNTAASSSPSQVLNDIRDDLTRHGLPPTTTPAHYGAQQQELDYY